MGKILALKVQNSTDIGQAFTKLVGVGFDNKSQVRKYEFLCDNTIAGGIVWDHMVNVIYCVVCGYQLCSSSF